MKVFYDSHTDTLSVILKDTVAVHESDEDKPGVILDYDKEAILYPLRFLTHPSESRTPATLIFKWLNDRWTSGTSLPCREKKRASRGSYPHGQACGSDPRKF